MSDSPVCVLLVDPDHALCDRVAVYLEEKNYDVRSLSNYSDALADISLHTPDVIVSEMNLGTHSGFDLLQRIHTLEHKMPFVFFSADGSVRDVVEALRQGVANYVLKPLSDFNVLVRVLEKAMQPLQLEQRHVNGQIALERANRELNLSVRELERDQAAGRLVQQKLSPPSPVCLGGLNIDYKIFPSLFLSGDAIDYGLIDNRYMAYYLTDISGHGSASAFIAVWIKQLVRGFFREQSVFHSRKSFDDDIPKLMALINQELIGANVGSHLTCFVGVIDTHTYDMNYVVAGHLPLPILISNADIHVLEGKGKPLGIFEDAQWEVNTLKLPSVFSLVVFSDGILEVAAEQGLIEKEAFLERTLGRVGHLGLQEIASELNLIDLEAAPDDVAMLLIRSLVE